MKYVFIILITLLCFSILEAKKEWVLVKEPINEIEWILELVCKDSLNCYTFSQLESYTEIRKSTDQGITWELLSNIDINYEDDLANIIHVEIYNDNNIYISYLSRIALEISENGGKDYRVVTFGTLSEIEGATFNGIGIYSDSISVGLTHGDKLIFTFDNWNTYEIAISPDSIWGSDPVYFIDSNNIAFARYKNGYNTEFIRYNIIDSTFHVWSQGTEAGKNNEIMSDLTFVNDTVGYMAGLRFTDVTNQSTSIIWKTTNRGRNWTKLVDSLYDPPFGLRSIEFRTENHGIAIGAFGKILETTDGGESWFQHEVRPDMKEFAPLITWAGSYPLFYSPGGGIFRLETVSKVEELSSNEKFKVYQSGDNLEIAINDPTHKKYIFELYSQAGQRLLTRPVSSSYGFIFQPIELMELNNGAYFYTISSDSRIEFSGKLVIVK